jgi:thioesterase domain-containing protein
VDDDTHPGLTTLFDSENPTTAFWILGQVDAFGPARLAKLTAPIRSYCIKIVGAKPPQRPLPSITAIGEDNANTISAARSANTVLIGFSLGTVLALETACALRRLGTPADLLILIDPPTVESLATFKRDNALPSPLRRPRAFLGMLRRRNMAMRHTFEDADDAVLTKRVTHRHTRLLLRHTVRPSAETAVLIQSQEYIDAGGTPLTDAGLVRPAAKFQIGGGHLDGLLRPELLAAMIKGIIRDHGLLPDD